MNEKETILVIKSALMIYYVSCVIAMVIYMIKHPSRYSDQDKFSLGDVIGYTTFAMMFAPFLVPMVALESIKFKRR